MLEWAGSHEGGYVRTKGSSVQRSVSSHEAKTMICLQELVQGRKTMICRKRTSPVINELLRQIENLHNELKLKSKELSESPLAVKELETQIKNLEEEIGKQANGFEADMEELIRAKVEQEQRTIHAEDNLRKKNFKTLILLANFKRNSENYQ
ncbi:hypothetical protein HanRHA438_Chr06g0249561 [Helianthus annuus]|nr:hypothetical protein HanRHA438_Chr06g0249561 [Helianthus annuus]